MRYKTYHWYHAPTGREGENNFSDQRGLAHAGIQLIYGSLSELDALKIMNLWNKGTHHDYRYWID